MMGFLMFVHALICIVLVAVILMQSGRGGGLTEGFGGSSAESMFGAQTNEFMTRATSILTVVFIVTCLSLAVMSARQGQSIMPNQTAAPVAPEVPKLPQSVDATKDLIEQIPTNSPAKQPQP